MKRGSSSASEEGEDETEPKELQHAPVRKAARRQDDPLLSALDRVSGIPLGLHRGDPVIHIPGIEGRRNQPVPQDDGLLRDAKTSVVTQGDDETAFNPAWRADWFSRMRALFDAEDYEFLQLLAGALKKTPEQLLEIDTLLLQQRTSQELAEARKVELEQLKRGVNERIDDLRKAQAQLDELRATRVAEQTGLVEPAQRLLQQDGLGALLRMDRGGLLYPYYMRWQYEFIADHIGSTPARAGSERPPLTRDQLSRIAFITATDASLGLSPSGDVAEMMHEMREGPDGTYTVRLTDEILRSAFRTYVMKRDFHRVLRGQAKFHGGLPLVLCELLDDVLRHALRLGYGHLPGLSPLAPSLSSLRDDPRGVARPSGLLEFPWFFENAPAFSTPYYWRLVLPVPPTNPPTPPTPADAPVARTLPGYPLVGATRKQRGANFMYGDVALDPLVALLDVAELAREARGRYDGPQYLLADSIRQWLDRPPSSDAAADYVLTYLTTSVYPPPLGPSTGYNFRRIVPTLRDYALVCDAVDILLGPLLLHGFESLFAHSPLFAVPATPLPNEIGQRVAALKTVLGQDKSTAFDPLRFYYTTEARPVMGGLQLGDMLAYVRYNTPAIVSPSAATLWNAGRNAQVSEVVTAATASPITVDKAARDLRYSNKLWDDLVRAAGVPITSPDKWDTINLIVAGNRGQPVPEEVKRQFESSDPWVVRDVVFPILFEGVFSSLVAQLGKDHPLTLGASYWPLQSRAIPVPAVEPRDKLDQKLLGRLGSASAELYKVAHGTSWSKEDFGAPTEDKIRFLQEMCPIAVLPLMADLMVALYGQDSALLAEIKSAEKIVLNLQKSVEAVSDARAQMQKLQARPRREGGGVSASLTLASRVG
jgi:hypothetical protein